MHESTVSPKGCSLKSPGKNSLVNSLTQSKIFETDYKTPNNHSEERMIFTAIIFSADDPLNIRHNFFLQTIVLPTDNYKLSHAPCNCNLDHAIDLIEMTKNIN